MDTCRLPPSRDYAFSRPIFDENPSNLIIAQPRTSVLEEHHTPFYTIVDMFPYRDILFDLQHVTQTHKDTIRDVTYALRQATKPRLLLFCTTDTTIPGEDPLLTQLHDMTQEFQVRFRCLLYDDMSDAITHYQQRCKRPSFIVPKTEHSKTPP